MKRQILFGEADIMSPSGQPITCQYHLLIRTVPPLGNVESYGVGIRLVQTGEIQEIWDITVRLERIEALARLLLQGNVTPCTLREIVDDWL